MPVVSLNITCKGTVMESELHSADLQLRLSGGLNEYFRLSCQPVCTLVHRHKSVLLHCSFSLGPYIDRNSCCKAHGGLIFVAADKPKPSVTNFPSFSSSLMASFGASIFRSSFVVRLEGPHAPDALTL
jgi:hypothetical protein